MMTLQDYMTWHNMTFCHTNILMTSKWYSLFQATVCLCDRDTCNGPSLPPREMIEDDHDIIDIEEVVREMNQEPADVQPEAVSSFGKPRTLNHHREFTIFMAVFWWKVIEGSF